MSLVLSRVTLLADLIGRFPLLEVGEQKVAHGNDPFFFDLINSVGAIFLLEAPLGIVAEGYLKNWASDLNPNFVFAFPQFMHLYALLDVGLKLRSD